MPQALPSLFLESTQVQDTALRPVITTYENSISRPPKLDPIIGERESALIFAYPFLFLIRQSLPVLVRITNDQFLCTVRRFFVIRKLRSTFFTDMKRKTYGRNHESHESDESLRERRSRNHHAVRKRLFGFDSCYSFDSWLFTKKESPGSF